MSKHFEEKIEKTHKADWHKWAGLSSTFSCILPILSEFESVIGDSIMMAIGGTSAVSVFAMLLKVGRVGAAATEIAEEHREHLEEDREQEIELRKKKNEDSLEKYGHYR